MKPIQSRLQSPSRSRLDRLHRVSAQLQWLGEREDIVQGLVDALEVHLGFEFGAVLLLDPGRGTLVPRAVSRQGKGEVFVEADKRFIASKLGGPKEGIAAWVARTGQSVRARDVRSDPRYLGLRREIRSELCVPLRVRGKVIGVFNTETTRPDAYRPCDQKALEIVAAEVAQLVAAERARLRIAPSVGPRRPRADVTRADPARDVVTRCAWCGRVRDSSRGWHHPDVADGWTSGQALTHGLCEECLERHYPE